MMKMKMKKRLLGVAIAASLGVAAVPFGAQAAILPTGAVLTIDPGIVTVISPSLSKVTGGSYFGMDSNGNGTISPYEEIPLTQGVQGLVIGTAQNYGGYPTHKGPPVIPPDSSNINAPWAFFGNTGKNYTTVPVTGGTANGLDLSGWMVTWNAINPIPMNTDAWGTGYSNGVGNFTWDGTIGDPYTLDYHAAVPNTPAGKASGFEGVEYSLYFMGNVTAGPPAPAVSNLAPVPIPAAAWLFGSGLIGLVGVARRRKGSRKG